MNAAILSRLRLPSVKGIKLPALRLPGRKARDGAPRSPPMALIGAWGGLAAVVGGIGAWLVLEADHTIAARRGAVAEVTVLVPGGPAIIHKPEPSTATAAAPPPAMEHAPAPAHATPAPPPAAPADHGDHAAPAGRDTHAAPATAAGHGAHETPPSPAMAPVPDAPGLPVPGPDGSIVLATAPIPALVEDSPNGPLPRIAADGRRPWQAYARPFPPDEQRPRIAIVMADMGMSGVTTGNALQKLPAGVTLAFVPFADRLDGWIERARGKGHEVILAVPAEPVDFPHSDPGPNALLTAFGGATNVDRLLKNLGKTTGYVGITTTTGGKFTANAAAVKPVMEALRARGLLFLDARLTPRSAAAAVAQDAGVPRAFVDRAIDRDLARGSIDDQLQELEVIAKKEGAAVGIGFPYPSTIERIALWANTVSDRGVVLAPLSAVVDRQKGIGG